MSRARDFADLAGSAEVGGILGQNLIINGAFEVAQGYTSKAHTESAINDCYTVDEFQHLGNYG